MNKAREAAAGLILRLREIGLMDHRLLSVFEQVPRQNFVPVIYHDEAYNRGQFPIECGQTMTSVDQIARSLHHLELSNGVTGVAAGRGEKRLKVLELGTGTGYQTMLLAQLSDKVISLERYRTLVEKARTRLTNLGVVNAQIIHADGADGATDSGLFDRIIANCAFDGLPKGFLDQLTSGGIMLAPVGPGDGVQILKKMTKVGSRFEVLDLFEVRCQPFETGLAQAI